MQMTKRSPVGEDRAAQDINVLGGAIDEQTFTLTSFESLAIAVIAARFGLSPQLARAVCCLAGLGGRCK